jgi:hypothetical protein
MKRDQRTNLGMSKKAAENGMNQRTWIRQWGDNQSRIAS